MALNSKGKKKKNLDFLDRVVITSLVELEFRDGSSWKEIEKKTVVSMEHRHLPKKLVVKLFKEIKKAHEKFKSIVVKVY